MALPCAACVVALAPLFVARGVAAEPSARAAWCAPEVETLPNGVCHFDGGAPADGRRTLVIFLHGVVPRNEPWQWTQERAIVRDAKLSHFEALMPRGPAVGPNGAAGYAWPGGMTPAASEDEMIASWNEARETLEKRSGRAFDDVFVLGFSSGAYYATSLALRGRLVDGREPGALKVDGRQPGALKVDGYMLSAGGAPLGTPAKGAPRTRPPIFIGVSSKDRASAPAARALGQSLAAWGWPHRVDEQPIGHMVGDVHVAHGVAWLRAQHERATAEPAASLTALRP